MSAAEPEPQTAAGHCRHCGTYAVRGKLIAYVDQASGPGFAVVECGGCAAKPPHVPAAEKPRTWSR